MRQVKNFPFLPPGKTVVVLSNFSLPHPKKGDIVNIRPSTKILNVAVENLLGVGSFKLLSYKQKNLKAENNKSSHKRKLIRRTVYQTFNTKLDMINV